MPVTAEWAFHECGRDGVSLAKELAPFGECTFCGHKHRVEMCEVCGDMFDIDWEGLVAEDGLTLCEYHSDPNNFN